MARALLVADERPARARDRLQPFRLTWRPFELYVDYWGTYTYDLGTGSIRFEILDGNYVPPPHFWDGVGRFAFQDSELVLEDIWLGSPRDVPPVYHCGHRFR